MNKLGLMLLLLITAGSTMAAEKTVKCRIENGNTTLYKGQCQFISDKGGSFSLMPPKKNKTLAPGLISISVSIVEEGLADVRGTTPAGINAEWGEAIRSKKDKSCWVGDEFKVCAWL